jgi:hypothetical protein
MGGNDISGQGSVAADNTSPEVMGGVGDAPVLPWSALAVDFSEPVDPAAANHLQTTASGSAVEVTWQAQLVGSVGSSLANMPNNDEASTVWAGRMSFSGRLSAWQGVSGALLTIATQPGVVDRSGNEALPWSQSAQVLDMKAPATSFDFETAISAGTWGTATLGDASQCESGGCLVLGPAVSCAVPTGVAGLLPAGTRTKMRMRYRAAYSSTTMSYDPAHGIILQLAAPGANPVGATLPELSYQTVTNGPEGLDRVSDWTTAEVALPTELQSGEAGFSIDFRRVCVQYGETKRAMWIESIAFE